jgi:undecaprenyl diphosphate synthase
MNLPNLQSSIPDYLPNHVGIILDGNRRWAKAAGKKTLEGHRKGSEVFKEISVGLFDRGVKYVTAYVFSKENWKRTTEEVDYLMRLVIKAVELHLEDFNKKGIRIKIIGLKDNLETAVQNAIQRTETKTANNTAGTLTLCFNYGGRQEIVDACKQIVSRGIAAEDITEELLTDTIYAPEIPDVDLLIRTSGEHRTSGFMMWRTAYAELLFIDTLWPDISMTDMDNALQEYAVRQRRFGC